MSDATLEALRAQGAHLHDPVRFRYLEALAMRMQTQPAAVQQLLVCRFREAVADYRTGAEQAAAQGAALNTVHPVQPATPSPMAQLHSYVDDRAQDKPGHGLMGETGSPSEMKSVHRFSEVWAKISAQQQLAKALTRGPEHAGPLNSHNLMLRAMSLMHELSPDYLRRFLSQADTVLWLEHLNQQASLKDLKPARRGRPKAST